MFNETDAFFSIRPIIEVDGEDQEPSSTNPCYP